MWGKTIFLCRFAIIVEIILLVRKMASCFRKMTTLALVEYRSLPKHYLSKMFLICTSKSKCFKIFYNLDLIIIFKNEISVIPLIRNDFSYDPVLTYGEPKARAPPPLVPAFVALEKKVFSDTR